MDTIYEKHSDPFSYKKGRIKNIILNAYAALEKLSVRVANAVICTGPGLVDQVNAMKTATRAFNIADIPSSLMEPSPVDIQQRGGSFCRMMMMSLSPLLVLLPFIRAWI